MQWVWPRAPAELPRARAFAALVIDACELVVEYLGAGSSAVALSGTCRRWRGVVGTSDCWAPVLRRVANAASQQMIAEIQAERQAGQYSYTRDWFAAIATHSRHACRWITNFPQECHTARGSAPACTGSGTGSGAAALPARQQQGFLGRLVEAARRAVRSQAPVPRFGGCLLHEHILVLGLDEAGKSTALASLAFGPIAHSHPMLGLDIEAVEHRGVTFAAWDVGGTAKIEPYTRLRYPYPQTRAVIFVVDAADVGRLGRGRDDDTVGVAARELHRVLRAPGVPRDVAVLVLANKQDAAGALRPDDVARRLGLDFSRDTPVMFCVQGCCATSGVGLREGLAWLDEALSHRSRFIPPPPRVGDRPVTCK